ncbi:MAG: glucosamine inositolphosphorylceramide transferase family protein [Flavobacteriales bacterium]
MKHKLLIGILIDKYDIPAWSYTMLQKIIASPNNEIVLIVKNKSLVEDENRGSFLYRLFSKFEKKNYKANPNALALKDSKSLLPFATKEVKPKKDSHRDIIEEADIIEIKKHNVDVFVKLGFNELSGEILKIAKYGVWAFHFGNNKVNTGGPAAFWEALEFWPETEMSLQILSEGANEEILIKKSYSLTVDLSPTLNANNYLWKAASLLPAELDRLHLLGEDIFFKNIEALNAHPKFYSNKILSTPTNKEMLSLIFKWIGSRIRYKYNSIFYFNQWILLFKLNNNNSISTSINEFIKIVPPKDRFWADPFILQRNNKYYIFLEELYYSDKKGHISVMTMDEKGNYFMPEKVLVTNYHLSYPFLIEDNGELYMIPETKKNRTIEVYKCTQFPNIWELELVLFDNIDAVDSTILFKDGKYWLFANVVSNKGASALDELHIFYSDKLLSKNWIAHAQNPVISDVKQSRPAGKFFVHKNNLYRPSQNCSVRYGYGMKINQVIELSETTYIEKTVDSITPDWDKNILATHTINHVDKLTVIDASLKRRK